MKQLLYLICYLLTASSTMGQDSTIALRWVHRAIIKFAPLSLLDPDATVQGGVEVRVSPRNSVQAEVGFGHKAMQIVTDEKKKFTDWSIWRVRSEWRHYTNRYRTNSHKNIYVRSAFPLGNYIAIEGFAKQITGTKVPLSPIDIPIFPNVPQPINRLVVGSHLKWGRQIAIPGASLSDLSRVLLDFYVGIGIRYGISNSIDTNDCSCGPFNDRFAPGNRFQPSLALGVKIGVGL